MKKLFILIILLLVLVSCRTIKPRPVIPFGTSDCPAACDKMKELKCPEGDDILGGPTCIEFCVKTQESGHSLKPYCLKTIKFCEEIQTKCGQ